MENLNCTLEHLVDMSVQTQKMGDDMLRLSQNGKDVQRLAVALNAHLMAIQDTILYKVIRLEKRLQSLEQALELTAK